MEVDYEENLCENQFFLNIKKHQIYEQIIANQWVLLIPRKGIINSKFTISDAFMFAHILIPSEDLPGSHFLNLNEHSVNLNGRKLTLIDKNANIESTILFEEIYYSKDLSKLKLYCIDAPLNNDNLDQNAKVSKISSNVKNIKESVQLLWDISTKSKTLFKKYDTAVSSFLRVIKQDMDNVNAENLKEKVQKLFKYCLDLVISNRKMRVKCSNDPFLLTNLKMSIEYYLMDKIYHTLFDLISISSAEQNSSFNKQVRKMAGVTFEDLGINSSLKEVVNAMKIEFIKIDDHSTSLDKLNCLKNTVDLLHNSNKSSKEVTMDDLLPVLIYLIVKSELNHWIPTLIFAKSFNLAQILDDNQLGSQSFLCTTLEAVILFIQSDCVVMKDQLDDLLVKDANFIETKQDYIHCLFYHAINNNDLELYRLMNSNYLNLINKATIGGSDEEIICHPLCSCSKCKEKKSELHPNVNVKLKNGLSLLHVAAKAGSSKVTKNIPIYFLSKFRKKFHFHYLCDDNTVKNSISLI